MVGPERLVVGRGLVLAALAVGTMGSRVFATDARRRPEVRETAQKIYSTLSRVLPLSLDEDKFRDPKQYAVIRKDLKSLVDLSTQFAAHGGNMDAGFKFVSNSLEEDFERALRSFERKQFNQSAFLLKNATENCATCHAQMVAGSDYAAGKGLFQELAKQKLDPQIKARLFVATRQFEEALKTYEGFLTDTKTDMAELLNFDLIPDYLSLCIRVKGDYARPRPVLEKVLKTHALPSFARSNLRDWIADLDAVPGKKLPSEPIAAARQLINEGRLRSDYAFSQRGLVPYLTASRILNEYIGGAAASNQQEMAEAYFLLGSIESLTTRSRWIAQGDYYLENAIRLAPNTVVAAEAFALLEENTLYRYSGADGGGGVATEGDEGSELLKELRPLAEKKGDGNAQQGQSGEKKL